VARLPGNRCNVALGGGSAQADCGGLMFKAS
jgi:hypothetical protein